MHKTPNKAHQNYLNIINKKIYSLDALQSQFYEWLPWIGQYVDQVPKTQAERLEGLKKLRGNGITPAVKTNLEKWYGKDKAVQVSYAESFEIYEYGSRPNDQDIKRLFPMLGK